MDFYQQENAPQCHGWNDNTLYGMSHFGQQCAMNRMIMRRECATLVK